MLLRLSDEIRLVQVGLLVACAGMAGLVLAHGLPGVVVSACLAGLGLSYVYPITISLLSREFGAAVIAAGVAYVYAVEHWRRIAAVDGRSFVESFRQFEGRAGGAADGMRGDVRAVFEEVEGGGPGISSLGAKQSGCQAKEPNHPIQRKQWCGQANCLPLAGAGE